MSAGQPQFEQSFLGEKEKELAQETFKTAVQPLREGFQERLDLTTEQLAKRGAFFGGAGQEEFLERAIKPQQQLEANLASRIATGIGESALDKAFIASEAAKQRQQQTSLQEAGFGQQTEQNLLGREFNAQERQAQQEFQTAFQERALEFQASEQSLARQEQRNQQALQLVLSGNVSQEDVQGQISALLGEGAALTSQDELQLQRLASASGLTTQEYLNIRGRIGTAQVDEILGSHFVDLDGTILDPSQVEVNRTELARIENEIAEIINDRESAGKTNRHLSSALNSRLRSLREKQRELTITEVPNINSFIQSPVAQQKFQQNINRLQAQTQVDIAEAESSKVLCTELNRQYLLDDDILAADTKHAKRMSKYTVRGYHAWAIPIVKKMRKSKTLTHALKPFIKAWAYQMAYYEGEYHTPNLLGAILELVGVPICLIIGMFCKEKKILFRGEV